MDSAEKDDPTAQHTLVTPYCVEDKIIHLTHEEIMHIALHPKTKSRINLSGLGAEEADDLRDDGIGNNKRTQQDCNTAKIFLQR